MKPRSAKSFWQRLTHAFTGSTATESLSISGYERPRAVRVEVEHLHKSFSGKGVLHDINLSVAAGETFAIIGPSGTGKSVLLKHLAGLAQADAGRIRIDGHELATATGQRSWRTALVFQTSALFNSLSVEQNVALWLREKQVCDEIMIRQVVQDKLAMVGLLGTEHLSIAELSGGMRKRVAIARALAMNADLMLYDEPTAELDPVTTDELARVIRSLRHQVPTTTIIVTHDLDFAMYLADRVAMMSEGAIIACGTPDEIRASTNPVVQKFLYTTTKGIKGK